ncbi:MAG TPA: MFS transporter [Usitatibacter sp.]|nr:MFS transporter [Usitatibacter sp.]
MTTIVAVRKDNTAVIAADSLTTFGNTRLPSAYDRHPEKITRYGDSFIGVAGSAAHQLVVENLLGRNKKLDFRGKNAIYESFRKLHPVLKEQAFLNPKEEEDDPYESSQMTVMIVNPTGIYAVYSMREVFELDRFWAIGSGRDFALGAMYTVYPKTRRAADVARAGMLAGAEFDTGTSEPFAIHEVRLK